MGRGYIDVVVIVKAVSFLYKTLPAVSAFSSAFKSIEQATMDEYGLWRLMIYNLLCWAVLKLENIWVIFLCFFSVDFDIIYEVVKLTECVMDGLGGINIAIWGCQASLRY